jgi:hypothetical protein
MLYVAVYPSIHLSVYLYIYLCTVKWLTTAKAAMCKEMEWGRREKAEDRPKRC